MWYIGSVRSKRKDCNPAITTLFLYSANIVKCRSDSGLDWGIGLLDRD
jgi:hypothetical protein